MRKSILVLIILLLSSTLSFAQDDDLTPYEIAMEHIAEVERTGATSLDLNGLGLTELPPEIWNLQDLSYLYLHSNELRTLPPEISNLQNLYVLNLYDNQLEILPPEIGNLENLHVLHAGNNHLSRLSPEISQLTNLCYLDIHNNRLHILPVSLHHLDNLIEGERCRSHGIRAEGNPLVFPPQEVVDEGTGAILDFLENPPAWYLQRYILWIAGGIGLIVLFISGIGWRLRSEMRKSKEKAKRS